MNEALIAGIRSNDHRTISQVISRIENDQAFDLDFYRALHDYSPAAIRIGLTGPPGAGKSTLVDLLIDLYLKNGKSVGVVAVDPTSPFTGGALLGDRVRMNRYLWNDDVFIRSMGSRGDLGGLARKTQEAGDVLAASGKDVIIYETVGVGQGEHDVAKAVDVTVVVLVPESGDEIQLMKAGLIEIADLFVVNKSDRDGADRLAHLLKNTLQNFHTDSSRIPDIFNTDASKNIGVADLQAGISFYVGIQKSTGAFEQKRLEHHRRRIFELVQNRLIRNFWTSQRLEQLESETNSLEAVTKAPHLLAEELLSGVRNG